VQQVVAALDAPRGNHGVNGLANGDAKLAQGPEISGRLNRDFPAAQFHHRE
jgi:hypothetical protein